MSISYENRIWNQAGDGSSRTVVQQNNKGWVKARRHLDDDSMGNSVTVEISADGGVIVTVSIDGRQTGVQVNPHDAKYHLIKDGRWASDDSPLP